MRHYIAVLSIVLLFSACSQDNEQKKTTEKSIVTTEVKKSSHKKEALVCLDTDDTITCKLLTKRVNKEREVEFEWKSPNGKDDREREMILPANHASIYDARSKKGRAKGKWTVEVELDDEETSASFFIN